MAKTVTRDQIIQAADTLFYQRGFEHTSFADIANVVSISRGNFYHHFKSKDAILNAVIDARIESTRALLAQWEQQAMTPFERIKCYIHILHTNWDKIHHYGCPVGTLCTELAKLNHASQTGARRIFSVFHDWLKAQFVALGLEQDADRHAMHILAWSQGVATMASTFQDKAFVNQEISNITIWLEDIVSVSKTA